MTSRLSVRAATWWWTTNRLPERLPMLYAGLTR